MKKKKLKKRIIYQSDTDMIRRTVQEISRIAGRNLLLYRCHCHLTQREVYYQTGINYPLISNYEKEIKNMCVYSFLITFYRTNFEQVAGDTVLKPLPGPLRGKSLSPALSVGKASPQPSPWERELS